MPLPLRTSRSRLPAGWLTAACAVAVALVLAGLRPRAATLPAQGAELQIVDVAPVSSGPICPGTGASFDVTVRNTGGGPATVMLAVMGAGRGLIAPASGVFTIGAEDSTTLRVDVDPQPQLIRDGAFRPTIAIVNASVPEGSGWLDRLFKDSNNADHIRQIHQPIAEIRDVTVTVTSLRVLDDCDSVSPGDWIVSLGVQAIGNHGKPTGQCLRRPPSGTSRDVSTGAVFSLEPLRLANVSTCSDLTITLRALDCDSDTLLPFVAIEGAGLGARCPAGRCGGEEVLELSGDHDDVGSITLRVPAAVWTAGTVSVPAGPLAIPTFASVPMQRTHPNGIQETVSGSDCALLAPYNALFTITSGS